MERQKQTIARLLPVLIAQQKIQRETEMLNNKNKK